MWIINNNVDGFSCFKHLEMKSPILCNNNNFIDSVKFICIEDNKIIVSV